MDDEGWKEAGAGYVCSVEQCCPIGTDFPHVMQTYCVVATFSLDASTN